MFPIIGEHPPRNNEGKNGRNYRIVLGYFVLVEGFRIDYRFGDTSWKKFQDFALSPYATGLFRKSMNGRIVVKMPTTFS